jgi:hypothetical protein
MTEKAKNLGNEFAYPFLESENDFPITYIQKGLTKREYFAAKAMQGLLADPNIIDFKAAAHWAVKCADDFLEELCKEENKVNEENNPYK